MAVQSLSLKTVHLVADTVWTGLSLSHSDGIKIQSCYALPLQVIMLGKDGDLKNFNSLEVEDKDLTVFTIENLVLSEDKNRILMKIVLKRKITTEMLTTFLPTILLLLITFTSILFDKELFGDALAVNLTIMLVMTTIFTSKIEELPPTSDTKMIDIWLIGCLLVPFTEVVLRTMIEVCGNCDHCKKLEGGRPWGQQQEKDKREAWKEGKDCVQDLDVISDQLHLNANSETLVCKIHSILSLDLGGDLEI